MCAHISMLVRFNYTWIRETSLKLTTKHVVKVFLKPKHRAASKQARLSTNGMSCNVLSAEMGIYLHNISCRNCLRFKSHYRKLN